MNRLILIGNGFDLAHGRETSYFHFAYWYLIQAYENSFKNGEYSDGLILIQRSGTYTNYSDKEADIKTMIDYCLSSDNLRNLFANRQVLIVGLQSYFTLSFRTNIKNDWFKHLLINCCENGWIDIENEYFKQLKTYLRSNNNKTKKDLAELNDALKIIIEKLREHLLLLPKANKLHSVIDLLQSDLYSRKSAANRLVDLKPGRTLILNFNYTDTFEQYVSDALIVLNDIDVTLNYIHGTIKTKSNPMIFGFGDELDTSYSEMQESEIDGFLDYVKTFWYLRTPNYQELVAFLEEEDYEVIILGLSCGLSDRTLLHMIFEHDHCKFIKLFHYTDLNGVNNFIQLTHAIARHFKSNVKLRDRLIPFDIHSQLT